LKGGVDFSFYR